MRFNSSIPGTISATIITAIVVAIVFFGWGPGSQYNGLKQANRWIDSNKIKFQELQTETPELNKVKLYVFTGGNGMIGVLIQGKLQQDTELRLYRFLLGSNLPRPLFINVVHDSNERS